jgi:type IV pilus assembly protein PilM
MSVLTKSISMPSLSSVRVRRPAPRPPTVTGLEIGATRAIAAQARLQGGRVVAERVAARALPPGLVRDGVVVEPDQLAKELKDLFGEHRLSKRVRVGLATPRTVLRVIDLPPLEDKDIRSALVMQAQERIPMPLDRAVMDYQTVGLVDTPDGRRLRVIVVVTEREGVDRLLDALRRAGLRPEGVDLSIFAVIRALTDGAEDAQAPVLYAQLGDLVNIAIAESGVCRFTRQAPQGLAMVLTKLAENLAMPTDQARALLHSEGVGLPREQQDENERSVGDLLARTAGDLGSELRAAVEFYSSQFGGNVTTGVVAGPLAPLPHFVDALAAASGLELTCGAVEVATCDALGDIDPCLAALSSGLAVGELQS